MNGLISVWISVIIFYMQTIVFILLWMDCCEILSILTLIETNGLGGVPFSYLRLCDIQWKFKGLLRSPYNFYFYFFPLTLSLLPFPSYSFPFPLSLLLFPLSLVCWLLWLKKVKKLWIFLLCMAKESQI